MCVRPAGRFCPPPLQTMIWTEMELLIESWTRIFTNRQVSLSTFDLHPPLWSDSVNILGNRVGVPNVTACHAIFLCVFLCIFALEIQAKGRQISIMKKKTICYKIYIEKSELSEIGKVCTSEAENLNLTHCGYAN